MFHHIVAMRFNEDADQAFFDRVEDYCERIRRSGTHVMRYVFRENVASRNDGLTHVILSTFRTSADHDAYQVSPVHLEMKSFMLPRIARIVVCELEDGE